MDCSGHIPYRIYYLLTPWKRVLLEKLIGFQLVKKFPTLYWTGLYKCLPPVPLLSNIDPVHALTSHFLKNHVKIILPSTHGSFKWSLSLRFSHQNPAVPIRATCPTHYILPYFITRTIFGEQYRSLSCSLCSFLHSTVTPSLLDPNILLTTLFSNTLSFL